jgi:hypothetical protein
MYYDFTKKPAKRQVSSSTLIMAAFGGKSDSETADALVSVEI